MAEAAAVVMGIGTAVSALGQAAEGEAAEAASKMAARQLEHDADQSEAEGLRTAREYRRRGDRTKSDAIAAMAAGGGVSNDVGAIKTLADIEQVYDYNSMAAIYQSRNRAQQQRFQAETTREEGHMAKRAGYVKSIGTVLRGGAQASVMGK